MNKTNSKNKLARNYKLPSTASCSNTQQTQKLEENVKQQEREISASPTSDTEMTPTKDSSFLSIDDLTLSQPYNPNSDVTWQVASPEVLKRVHRAILLKQKMRKKKYAALHKDENDVQLAAEVPSVNNAVSTKGKKRVKIRKGVGSRIENTIKTIEMKMQSDEFRVDCELYAQGNSTSPSSDPLCLEACSSHSSKDTPSYEQDSCNSDTKTTSNDITRERQTTLFSFEDCRTLDDEAAWSEDELLNESLVETILINNSINNSSAIHNSCTKLQSPKVRNNLKDSDQSSCQKRGLSKKKTPSKTQKVTSEKAPSVSEDMDLSDTDIDEMLSQLHETDFHPDPVASDLQQNVNNRVTRSMVKKANLVDNSDQVNQNHKSNKTNESCTVTKKVRFLIDYTAPEPEAGISSKALNILTKNGQQQSLSSSKRGDDMFDDSEITDELLVDVYEDLFKDDMDAGNNPVASQIPEPATQKIENQVCSKEEIERKKQEALKRRNCKSKTKRK